MYVRFLCYDTEYHNKRFNILAKNDGEKSGNQTPNGLAWTF